MNTREAQAALVALGYNLGKGGPSGNGDDGVWGSLSRTACAAFQRGRGLTATGG
ncbi:peptidoglycan-binding protein [Bosea sp. RCC_152_1]|uniref:peptidoglycan-binding domain-containing protein n=1 Tax=Bosea sp. RCC_152_1 TaxID=3239228 RepID=UPI0035265E5F